MVLYGLAGKIRVGSGKAESFAAREGSDINSGGLVEERRQIKANVPSLYRIATASFYCHVSINSESNSFRAALVLSFFHTAQMV
jgi:hypothetical protein